MEKLRNQQAEALEAYKQAKAHYLEDMTNDNWIKFCDARTNCMRLGVKI